MENIKEENIGKLYVVPTPVGNLGDMTFRAIEILKNVDYILAEDTRVSRKLLNYFEINKELKSYYKEKEMQKSEQIVNDILQGKNVALISDAGTPGISDPGMVLIKEAIKKEIRVEVLPGATAMIPAIVSSGMDTTHFVFYGFIQTKGKKKREELEKVMRFNYPVIIYEAPHRIKDTLKIINEIDEKREVSVAREISKIHETIYRGVAKEVLENIVEKGEIVLIIEGEKEESSIDFKNMSIEEHYKYYEIKGLNKKEIIKQISKDLNCPKNDIYKMFI